MKKRYPVLLALALIGAACGDDDVTLAGADSFCELAEEREAAETEFFDTSSFFDPEDLKTAFELNRGLLDRAVELAPDEIEGDLELLQTDLENTYEVLEANDFDATVAFGADIESVPGAEEAGDRVDDYIRENCGIDPDANEPSDVEIGEMLDESVGGGDLIRQALAQAGFTEEQAGCLAERISFDEFTAASGGTVPDDLLERFEECGVDMGSLAELGGADPEDLEVEVPPDLPQEGIDLFVNEMVNQGFTEDEARCLADSMFAAGTTGDVLAAFEACDIPLSRLQELGGG